MKHKFRGQRNNGEWVYGFLVQYKDVAEIHTTEDRRVWRVKPESVGMYTGLDDRNGVEIFSGDECSLDPFDVDEGFLYTVTYDTDACAFLFKLDNGDTESMGDFNSNEIEVIPPIPQSEVKE